MSKPAIPAEAMMALMKGQKIDAIRIIREHTTLAPGDAVALAEQYAAGLHPERTAPEQRFGRLPNWFWLMVGILAGGTLAFLFGR